MRKSNTPSAQPSGVVPTVYAKKPMPKDMKALDKTKRTINDYAKLSPYGRR